MLKLPKGEITCHCADRRFGYFFCLAWDHSSPEVFQSKSSHAKRVFDAKPRLEVEFLGSEHQQLEMYDSRCRAYSDFQHFMLKYHENVVVGYRYGTSEQIRDGLIYCEETAYHFIGQPLLEKLHMNGLSGLVVSKVTQEKGDFFGEWLRDDEIVMIDGKYSPIAPMTILPEEANRCEHCGYAPLLCPGCGKMKLNDWDSSALCWKCGNIWQLASDAPELKQQEMRIQDADPFPGSFVDMARWDGSDFNTGMLVTRRVVNLFEQLKCGSFRAEPVAVDVTGLTDEQWQRLEASREPC